jgi:urease accessory protein
MYSLKKIARLGLATGLLAISLPALAHLDASHVNHATHTSYAMDGFGAGLFHPLTGLDHLLAMLAVGLWAAQSKGAGWSRPILLPAMFLVMMVLGAVAGVNGFALPAVETGIALSVTVLGLLLAFAVRMPLPASTVLVALFGVAHGYAHGLELPATASAVWYGAGFVLATASLHLLGLGLSLSLNRNKALLMSKFSGAAIATFGMLFLVNAA